MARHFLKTVIIFTALLILGLAGVLLVGFLDRNGSGDPYQIFQNIG